MKTTHLFLIASLAAALPASAQTASQLKQENQQLKAELQALQARCETPTSPGTSWKGQALEARIDTLRVGIERASKVSVTIAMTLRNTGDAPMPLNYETNSLSVTDDNGYHYTMYYERVNPEKTIKGIPAATNTRADTSAVIMPGGVRTVTFITDRNTKNGQTPGTRFDVNATFGQYQDLGQGRIRKVRDYPVAFTNVSASGRGYSSGASTGRASDVVEQAANRLINRLTK